MPCGLAAGDRSGENIGLAERGGRRRGRECALDHNALCVIGPHPRVAAPKFVHRVDGLDCGAAALRPRRGREHAKDQRGGGENASGHVPLMFRLDGKSRSEMTGKREGADVQAITGPHQTAVVIGECDHDFAIRRVGIACGET
jgi:hypothetical protein